MITNTTDHIISFYELLHWYEKERTAIDVTNLCKYWVNELDEYLGWIGNSELIVIWAQTWVWKSELAYNIWISNAKRWKKVLLFALEWDLSEIASRWLQKEISEIEKIWTIDFRFNTNRVHKVYVDNILQSIEIEKWEWKHRSENLLVFNKKDIPTFEFIAELIELFRDQVDMIIIDHLHYIDFWDRSNEIEAISKVMRKIKVMTDTIKKPVILVSHLKKPDKERDPTVFDLYGSSNIAKEATTILLLSRCEVSYMENKENYKDLVWTKIQIAKSRAWLPVPSYFEFSYSLSKKSFIKWVLLEWSRARESDKIVLS